MLDVTLIRKALLGLALCVPCVSPVHAQDEPDEEVEAPAPAPARTAERAEVKALLRGHKDATKARDAALIAAALEAMVPCDNADFLKPARAAFQYRPSKVDQQWARDEAAVTGFEGDADEIERLLQRRIELVEVAAAHVLAYQDRKKAGKVLTGAFESGDLRNLRPASARTVLDVLVRIEWVEATDAVVRELGELRSPDMARACLDFLVKIETRSEKAVLALCDLLRAPAPANVDDPSNPPAEYWEARWKAWSPIRRDVQAALLKLTGKDWKADEGEKPGDADAARKWVKSNARKLGLR